MKMVVKSFIQCLAIFKTYTNTCIKMKNVFPNQIPNVSIF